MELAREHWKIESMHWILDVTFSEDDSRFLCENANRTMNALRKFALAVHKNFLAVHHLKSSIKSHMLSVLLDTDSLLDILFFLKDVFFFILPNKIHFFILFYFFFFKKKKKKR